MIKVGKAPYLECSSKGDTRFSAFYAFVNGETIEHQYQAFKVFADGSTNLSWREAKGRKAVNQKAASAFYAKLWKQYLAEHPLLRQILKKATGLSDVFGQKGHVCQAQVLWRLTHED